MLQAGGGEHELQNSEREGNTCCHQDSLLHGTTCMSTSMLDNEAIFGQWQTVDNNLTVSLHHDAARCSTDFSSYQQQEAIIEMPIIEMPMDRDF